MLLYNIIVFSLPSNNSPNPDDIETWTNLVANSKYITHSVVSDLLSSVLSDGTISEQLDLAEYVVRNPLENLCVYTDDNKRDLFLDGSVYDIGMKQFILDQHIITFKTLYELIKLGGSKGKLKAATENIFRKSLDAQVESSVLHDETSALLYESLSVTMPTTLGDMYLPSISCVFRKEDSYVSQFNEFIICPFLNWFFKDESHLESVRSKITNLQNVVMVFTTAEDGLCVICYCGAIPDGEFVEHLNRRAAFTSYIINSTSLRADELQLSNDSYTIANDPNVWVNFDGRRILPWSEMQRIFNSQK